MIDILMATYNGEAYIKEQLQSIFDQTYTHWTLYIQDDRSNDQTLKVAQAQADAYTERVQGLQAGRIKILTNDAPKGGACGNFMKLLEYAHSDYVMFCDQDDYWHADKMYKTLKFMKKAEKRYGADTPILVYTDLAVVDQDMNPLAPSFIRYMQLPPKIRLPRLLMQNSVAGCSMMMNRALYQMMRRMPYSEDILMHDHLAALLAKTCGKIFFMPEATIDYRQHAGNAVGASKADSFRYLWKRFIRGRKAFQEDMRHAMRQAERFDQIFGEDIIRDIDCKLIRGFANLQHAGKLKRLKFYLKNGVIKYGTVRAVMQFIWG